MGRHNVPKMKREGAKNEYPEGSKLVTRMSQGIARRYQNGN
jgi:hypothetical protein